MNLWTSDTSESQENPRERHGCSTILGFVRSVCVYSPRKQRDIEDLPLGIELLA